MNLEVMYLHAAGESQTPRHYHEWVCRTLTAACVSDRVWVQRLREAKLHPNLYTILIGPSGLGKGRAIGFGLQFRPPSLQMHHGAVTSKALIDKLTRESSQAEAGHRLFLVMPELAADLGHKTVADEMVKYLTEVYETFGQTMDEGTRMHGAKRYRAPSLVTLMGSTLTWLNKSVGEEAVRGGFFGRTVPIMAEYDFDTRYSGVLEPSDVETVLQEITGRFADLSVVQGEMYLDEEATAVEEEWVQHRQRPRIGLEPFWFREPALMLKLAMIASLHDGLSMMIRGVHIQRAKEWLGQIRVNLSLVLDAVGKTPLYLVKDALENEIKRRGSMTSVEAFKFTRQHQLDLNAVEIALRLLVSEEAIVYKAAENGPYRARSKGWRYWWKGHRAAPFGEIGEAATTKAEEQT